MQVKTEIAASLISLVPILLWGIYFYLKNPRKQNGREILEIFLIGFFSILPIWMLHQWILPSISEGLQQIWPVFEHPFIFGFLELLVIILFVFLFILIFASLHSIQFKILYHLPWKNSFSAIYKRLYSLTPILFFFGGFLVFEAIFSFKNKDSFILSLTGSTLLFAILEEYFKYIINPFLVYKKISSIGTAMVHALYVGLAFAFIENILFFYHQWGSPDFLTVFGYRSLFTTLMHVGASGILGYFYGLSIFGQAMLVNQEIEKSHYEIPNWFKKFLKKTTFYKSVLITQGFFLAALFHALFNLLVHLGHIQIAAVLSIIMAGVIFILLNSRPAQIQYGLIGSRAMPEEDFERLRLQISVLQHVKEIQEKHPNEPQLKEIIQAQKQNTDQAESD